MGAHPEAPSSALIDENETSLAELIRQDPRYYLGAQAAEKYGSLPFLFKLLAAEKPLSIQTHPNLSQAREGYDRENRAGLAPDSPVRNYRDPNHKPEIICALSPFSGMCGFRTPMEIQKLLIDFLGASNSKTPESVTLHSVALLNKVIPSAELYTAAPESLRTGMAALLKHLDDTDTSAALKNFFMALFTLSDGLRKDLGDFITNTGAQRLASLEKDSEPYALWKNMVCFAKLYPGDPAVISPLYLNFFRLNPGEAIFLPAGTLHAYIHGLGVELMANSDNVLRGGLTPKHIDIEELSHVLDFTPHKPEIIKPSGQSARFAYPAPCGEFSLSVIDGAAGDIKFQEGSAAICVVTSGELEIQGTQERAVFRAGQSIFIPPAGELVFRGNYTLYAGIIPASADAITAP